MNTDRQKLILTGQIAEQRILKGGVSIFNLDHMNQIIIDLGYLDLTVISNNNNKNK